MSLSSVCHSPRRGESGSVLLETVVIMPLYMLLIGCAMWFGELALVKQRLTVADRYAAWSLGNRHRESSALMQAIKDEVAEQFTPESDALDLETAVSLSTGDRSLWGCDYSAGVSALTTMSTFTQGWIAAGEGLGNSGSGDGIPQRMGYFVGRDVQRGEGEAYRGHVVIMRSRASSDSPRTWSGRQLSDQAKPWLKNVYQEGWPYE
ncbi:MAG: hypothetical protein HN742_12545 [Lentisphaerae bacterium]|nr:hypothetical protein [Lentisphaerota bacterium]MBT7842698.1 hypothetical protein [Lentisphaerota bacterium]